MTVLRSMVKKELLQLRRDPALLRLVIMVPLVQLLVLAYAINNDLQNLGVGVLDEDRSPASRLLVDALEEADVFVPGPSVRDTRDAEDLLVGGECDLVLHIPRGFTRDAGDGRSPAIGIIVDGTNSSIGGRAAGYAQGVLLARAARDAGAAAPAATVPAVTVPAVTVGAARITAEPRFFYNPELESRLYMIPGIIVMLVTIISALVTGMAVVREKEIGTLEQVMVTPISSWQYVIGKTLPFALIALLDLLLATVFACLWFRIPLVGSPLVLLLGVLAYLLVTLGLGLLASAVSQTQQQAMFTVWFFLIFAILLSGFFFPVENMPAWARALTYLNPMRFFMEIVRGVFLRGAGLGDIRDELLTLLVMGLVSFTGAVAIFRRSTR